MSRPASADTSRLLEISGLPGIGASALRSIVGASLRGEGALSLTNDELVRRFSRSTGRGKTSDPNRRADEIQRKCADDRQIIISALDNEYPSALRHIDDFPTLLFVKGSLSSLRKPSVAVVGTREVSRLGENWTRQIARIIADFGFSVTSGLALGVDTAAHQGALAARGTTIAVLAHGLDRITPSSNAPLACEILDCDGALISEHPPGVPPRRQEYVKRNRIQSGMSLASIVIESGHEGGAIHQGNFTFKQGRQLYCLYPERGTEGAVDFRYDGADRLIGEVGAAPIRNRGDLLALIAELESILKISPLNSLPEAFRETNAGRLI